MHFGVVREVHTSSVATGVENRTVRRRVDVSKLDGRRQLALCDFVGAEAAGVVGQVLVRLRLIVVFDNNVKTQPE